LEYSEDDVFDVIEFLYDVVSKPIKGFYHSFNSCGWHYSGFDREAGRQEFRQQMNEVLRDYSDGFMLSDSGEILVLGEPGLQNLLDDVPVEYDPHNVDSRISSAVLKYRYHRASLEDKREAVRALADILEFLRPRVKDVLIKSDESDLFHIANNFGIRHHNDVQKTDYDEDIFLDWLFYYYLAAAHACTRLIVREGATTVEP
jgi:hypothetical protein